MLLLKLLKLTVAERKFSLVPVWMMLQNHPHAFYGMVLQELPIMPAIWLNNFLTNEDIVGLPTIQR
jgi:hypothetical protein